MGDAWIVFTNGFDGEDNVAAKHMCVVEEDGGFMLIVADRNDERHFSIRRVFF